MTNRNRSIRKAFQDGYAAGLRDGAMSRESEVNQPWMDEAFKTWACDNPSLLDGVPLQESRILQLERKLEQIESEAMEMRARS